MVEERTYGALKAAGEGAELLQHGVGALLERLGHLLRVLRVGERVELLREHLLELLRVLLDLRQRALLGGVAAHHPGGALRTDAVTSGQK